MKNVEYGYSAEYDQGRDGSVAMNGRGAIVEVHETENGELWYHVGSVVQATIELGASTRCGESGSEPCCAVNDTGMVVSAYRVPSGDLHIRVGDLSGQEIAWRGPSASCGPGDSPGVAIDDAGHVVFVYHIEGDALMSRAGRIEGASVTWYNDTRRYAWGRMPAVAMNASGVVVAFQEAKGSDHLFSIVGRLDAGRARIAWGPPGEPVDIGLSPAIAVTDDGLVIGVYGGSVSAPEVMSKRVGQVADGDVIAWRSSDFLANGILPAVACNDVTSIQIHRSPEHETLWFSTSLIMDRSSWMHDSYDRIAGRTLRQVAMPASHDAGMYQSNRSGLTQDLSLKQQLEAGIRYFDLRPKRNDNSVLVIHHGDNQGPTLGTVLSDIQSFIEDGREELIILKFSHYTGFNDAVFAEMVAGIKMHLERWLLPLMPEESGAVVCLGSKTMSELIDGTSRVLVVCDLDYALTNPEPGIFVYRDYDKDDVSVGNLVVYDKYSNTESYSVMSAEQETHYRNYTGTCPHDAERKVDLFLLSWTLTPHGTSSPNQLELCREPDTKMGLAVSRMRVPNTYDQMLNLTFVDFSENARGTDVCMYLNGLVPAALPAP